MNNSKEQAVFEVLAADDARYAAMIARDLAALGALLAEELLYTQSSGVAETKAAVLAAVESGKYRYKTARRHDVSVHVIREVALMNGFVTLELDVDGAPTTLFTLYSSVWVKTSGGWQLSEWESLPTLLPSDGP